MGLDNPGLNFYHPPWPSECLDIGSLPIDFVLVNYMRLRISWFLLLWALPWKFLGYDFECNYGIWTEIFVRKYI